MFPKISAEQCEEFVYVETTPALPQMDGESSEDRVEPFTWNNWPEIDNDDDLPMDRLPLISYPAEKLFSVEEYSDDNSSERTLVFVESSSYDESPEYGVLDFFNVLGESSDNEENDDDNVLPFTWNNLPESDNYDLPGSSSAALNNGAHYFTEETTQNETKPPRTGHILKDREDAALEELMRVQREVLGNKMDWVFPGAKDILADVYPTGRKPSDRGNDKREPKTPERPVHRTPERPIHRTPERPVHRTPERPVHRQPSIHEMRRMLSDLRLRS